LNLEPPMDAIFNIRGLGFKKKEKMLRECKENINESQWLIYC